MSVGGISCVHMNPLDADIVTRNDSIPRFRFRFPDTDAIVGPTGDDRTLSGPATIAVSHVADDLPCGLINDTCQATAAGLGLVACVDQLFARDGTCDPTPDQTFTPHGVAATGTTATCWQREAALHATPTRPGSRSMPRQPLILVHWQGIL
jgi:hypothetical protein